MLTHNDNHLRNSGSTVALLEWHSVHASITQAGAIGSPLANADGLPGLNVTVHVAKSKCTVKRMGTERGIPKEGTHRDKGAHHDKGAHCDEGAHRDKGTHPWYLRCTHDATVYP
jgi:hypothetical protein